MKHMMKKHPAYTLYTTLTALVLCALFALVVYNITTVATVTFRFRTGDTIKVKLNTLGGYTLGTEYPFTVSKDGEVLLKVFFDYAAMYNAYRTRMDGDCEELEFLMESRRGNVFYFSYLTENAAGEEYNCIMTLPRSSTCIIMTGTAPHEIMQDVVDHLSFQLA